MLKSREPSPPLTVAFIRDELRKNQFSGDLFSALRFMLEQYDEVNTRLKVYTRPREYTVRMDVV